MDCEKLDAMAMDLVDPDGDDGIDARAQRDAEEHLAGCTRCTAVIERLRGGMRAASELGFEDPSSLLEARIFAAAGAVQPDVSFPRRVSRAISAAGSWAMRPQVAMAAVLVVMVGTSVVLLRGQGDRSARNTKVTEEGTPVATLEPPVPTDPGGAPAIVGGGEKKLAEKEAQAPAKEPPKEALPEGAGAKATDTPKLDENDGDKAAETTTKNKPKLADESPNTETKEEKKPADDSLSNSNKATGKSATAPAQPAAPPAAAAPKPAGGDYYKDNDGKADLGKKGGAATGAGALGGAAGPMPAPTTTAAPNNATAYDDAMTAYKESKWAVAGKGFDTAAAAGQKVPSSLLYSARSYRAAGSCAQALPRYQKLVNGYAGSAEAPHGAIEGGQCAKALSDIATARVLFEKAKTYPVTQKQAEAELAALDKPASPPPPAKAKAAKPPSASVDSAY